MVRYFQACKYSINLFSAAHQTLNLKTAMIDTKQIIYLNDVWMKLNVLLVKLF